LHSKAFYRSLRAYLTGSFDRIILSLIFPTKTYFLQFLSFIKNLELNPGKDCKKDRIKKQNYYVLKFPLSQFVEFTGIQNLKDSQRKKLILYFKKLQNLDPIVKEFSNGAFRSYVCFPYVECENPFGNSWIIEVLAAEELFCFPYPFQLPKSFLISKHKNDLRLKVRLMKSEQEKLLDLQEFFKPINVFFLNKTIKPSSVRSRNGK